MKFTLRPLLFAAFLVLVLAVLVSSAALAQEGQPRPVSDNEVNAIAKQLFCPVCENIPLDVCPTQACAEWRELIRDKLSIGWTEDQIKDYFVQQYGDRVLGTPPVDGNNSLLNTLFYIIPPVAILAGAYVLFRAFKAWRVPAAQGQAANEPAASLPTIDDEYVHRLEEELNKR